MGPLSGGDRAPIVGLDPGTFRPGWSSALRGSARHNLNLGRLMTVTLPYSYPMVLNTLTLNVR